jgi:hypothetical protein
VLTPPRRFPFRELRDFPLYLLLSRKRFGFHSFLFFGSVFTKCPRTSFYRCERSFRTAFSQSDCKQSDALALRSLKRKSLGGFLAAVLDRNEAVGCCSKVVRPLYTEGLGTRVVKCLLVSTSMVRIKFGIIAAFY